MSQFNSFGLKEELVQATDALGFTEATPIQVKAITHLIKDQTDLIALAQTGTGKTAAYGLPILHLVDTSSKLLQYLILCPTRELCMQIKDDLESLAKFMNVNITSVYGGTNIQQQIRDIRRGTQIVVATPGRLMDIMERGEIKFNTLKAVILDEADEMLNMGFKEDIDHILSDTPEDKNIWLFSATMPAEIRNIVRNFMEKPVELKAGDINRTATNIQHHYYIVRSHDKYSALKRIVDFHPSIYGLIFCRTKAETQEVADHLMRDGYNADALHGDLSQGQRDTVMNRFRDKTLQILVATDVAARGIDVDNITHVIQYTLPDETEVYTHRSGRTARAGKSGISIVMVTPRDTNKIKDLERLTGSKFKAAMIPTGYQVCEQQLLHIVDTMIHTEVNEEDIAPFMSMIEEKLAGVSKEDLVKRVASMEFNRFLSYYKDSPNLNYAAGEKTNQNLVRLFVGIGELDELDKIAMIKLLAQQSGLSFNEVRKVDVLRTFSFFEVDKANVEKVKAAFNDFKYRGRSVRVEEASKRDGGGRERSGDERGGGERRSGGYERRGGGEGRSSSRAGGRDNDRTSDRERKSYSSDRGGDKVGYGKKPGYGKSDSPSKYAGKGKPFPKKRD